jgi:riboflavin-specific deaminase-like protein
VLDFRQLIPEPGTAEIGELLASVDFVGMASAERPYSIVNFVSSADGRVAFQGRSGKLGDDGDKNVFHTLRERVDAVLVGTGTLRTERYGRLVRDEQRRHRRAAAGLRPEPLAALLSRSGDVPLDIPLFAAPESHVVIFSPAPVDTSQCAAEVEVVQLDMGEVTLTTVLRRLRSRYDVRALLCEGGPTMFGALLQEELVDELFLTLAPKLAGGGAAPTIASGPELTELVGLEPAWVLERGGSLYLRYLLR